MTYVGGRPENRNQGPFFGGWRRDLAIEMLRAESTQNDIARAFGCADRTVLRWLQSDAEAREIYDTTQRWHHGVSGYVGYGCRCDVCRAANTRYHAEARKKRRPEAAPVHGSASTYSNWNCRCDPCTRANAERNRPYARAWYQRQKEAARG